MAETITWGSGGIFLNSASNSKKIDPLTLLDPKSHLKSSTFCQSLFKCRVEDFSISRSKERKNEMILTTTSNHTTWSESLSFQNILMLRTWVFLRSCQHLTPVIQKVKDSLGLKVLQRLLGGIIKGPPNEHPWSNKPSSEILAIFVSGRWDHIMEHNHKSTIIKSS